MALFKIVPEVKILPTLTAEMAQSIYELLKTNDINTLFLEQNIPTEYSSKVSKEINKLENEMVSKMNGSFELTARVPATYDDEGEIVDEEVPATYFKVTTEKALKGSMSSVILDIPTIVTDVRIWSDGKPDEEPTWSNYLLTFKPQTS